MTSPRHPDVAQLVNSLRIRQPSDARSGYDLRAVADDLRRVGDRRARAAIVRDLEAWTPTPAVVARLRRLLALHELPDVDPQEPDDLPSLFRSNPLPWRPDT